MREDVKKKQDAGGLQRNMYLLVTAIDVTSSNVSNYNTSPAIFSFIRRKKQSNAQVNLHAF